MSFIEDFATIKADLAKLEEAKKGGTRPIVTEGKATDWVDAVYGMYGYPKTVPDDLCALDSRNPNYERVLAVIHAMRYER